MSIFIYLVYLCKKKKNIYFCKKKKYRKKKPETKETEYLHGKSGNRVEGIGWMILTYTFLSLLVIIFTFEPC